MTDARRALLAVLLTALTGCALEQTPSASPTPVPSPTSPAATPTPTAEESSSASASASATPEPPLSLEPPEGSDPRVVTVTAEPNIGADGGVLLVTVTSASDQRIDELVLRWPTALDQTLFVAPFTPSEDRIRDGGPPLVQPWTKWVVGPGEQGEPAGTTSLGYGPLLAGATLEMPLVVTRRAPGPVAFDLQVLAGNDLLALADGSPAELRIEVP
ncbi:MAG TPA: hypothetical protein VFN76_03325 [Candidatus Limnocylindria bacterium]|nr:hypothetical protein [Candidatus Limnocylindria bacterium]